MDQGSIHVQLAKLRCCVPEKVGAHNCVDLRAREYEYMGEWLNPVRKRDGHSPMLMSGVQDVIRTRFREGMPILACIREGLNVIWRYFLHFESIGIQPTEATTRSTRKAFITGIRAE